MVQSARFTPLVLLDDRDFLHLNRKLILHKRLDLHHTVALYFLMVRDCASQGGQILFPYFSYCFVPCGVFFTIFLLS